jgi:nucleoid-associated protein YgaU
MFDQGSRYYYLDSAHYTFPSGLTVTYRKRRILPRAEDMALKEEVTVTEGERLDQIAYRTLGNPEHFWRICDANNAMNPFELTDEPGRTLRIPVPQFEAVQQ